MAIGTGITIDEFERLPGRLRDAKV